MQAVISVFSIAIGSSAICVHEKMEGGKGTSLILEIAELHARWPKPIPKDTQQPVMFLLFLLSYNDPHIPVLPSMRHYPHLHMASKESTADYLRLQDCLVIVTDHSAYDWERILEHADLVVDTRNATRNVRGHYDKVILA